MNISPVQTDSLTGTTRLNRPTSERETFLNLLVTQLNNQDPMSPIQNEDRKSTRLNSSHT